MSDANDFDDPTIEQLRNRADQAAAFERQVNMQGAELKILKAGVPTGTKVGQAFINDLAQRDDVDLNNPEAIHAAAVEWGLWQPEGSEAKEVPADQQGLAAARGAIQTGSAPDAAPPPPPDLIDEGWANFKKRVYDQGARREDAAAEVIDRIVTGAVNGDERAIIKTQGTAQGPIQRAWNDRDVPYVPGRER
jgi:hypothetical protein